MRLLLLFTVLALSTSAEPRVEPVDHSLWDALVGEFVDRRYRVDYQRLNAERRDQLDAYAELLAEPVGEPLSAEASKALLINAYNALTVRWVLDHYPVPSIWATPNPFKEPRHKLGGEVVSLDEVESRLRKTGDPRIHAALVCAARSCPPLRREAYVAARVDEQLDDNTRQWLADPALNRFDAETGEARVSKVFDWYREDFQAHPGGLEGFLREYGPPGPMAALGDKKLRISFLEYDWGLNDQSEVGENYSWFQLAVDWLRNLF